MTKSASGRISFWRRMAVRLGVACLVVVFAGILLYFWKEQVQRRYQPVILSPGPAVRQASFQELSGRRVIRILAVNGGGVRGIIPAEVLAYLEEKTGHPAADLFDLFIGTSSGGIVTTGCLIPGKDGKPRNTAEEVSQDFTRVAPAIFEPSPGHVLITMDGIFAPKYSSRKKYDAFLNAFGTVPFGRLIKPSILMAYDMSDQCPAMMGSWLPEWSGYGVASLVGAATTVQGVFDPLLLQGADGKSRMFTDFGIIENDPSADVVDLMRKTCPDAQIVVVNLGTGRFLMNGAKIVNMGDLRWITDLLPYLESSNVLVTKTRMMSEQAYEGPSRLIYVDIDIDMPQGQFYHPFNGSPQNLANIRSLGLQCVELNKAALDRMADILVSQAH